MAWIESHDTLARHPKTKRLMRALGISRPQAIGHLHLLWWWTLEFAQDGDLSRFAADELADAAEWDGDPDTFFAALVQAGFIDQPAEGAPVVHDWQEYAGRLIEQRERNAARQRAWRARHSDVTPPVPPPSPPPQTRDGDVTARDISPNSYVTVTSPSRNGATVPNQTVPDQTIPDLDPLQSLDTPTGASAPTTRGTRIPQPFLLTIPMRTWAAEHVPRVDVQTETANFCDYWRSVPGQKGCKLDWEATWRTWMRGEQKKLTKPSTGGLPNATPDKLTTKLRNIRASVEADYAQWADDGSQDGDQGPAYQHVPRLLPQPTTGRRGA